VARRKKGGKLQTGMVWRAGTTAGRCSQVGGTGKEGEDSNDKKSEVVSFFL
jgi:hypothetical protein